MIRTSTERWKWLNMGGVRSSQGVRNRHHNGCAEPEREKCTNLESLDGWKWVILSGYAVTKSQRRLGLDGDRVRH
jgi:hypothetical protein